MVTPLRNVRIDDKKWEMVELLAQQHGVTASDILRDCIPNQSVILYYIENRNLDPSLCWKEVVNKGIRKHLLTLFKKNTAEQFSRLGLTYETASAGKIDAARERLLKELQDDPKCPCEDQIEQAETNLVYLGRLHEAFQRAKRGEKGYLLLNTLAAMPGGKDRPDELGYWVVYVNGAKL